MGFSSINLAITFASNWKDIVDVPASLKHMHVCSAHTTYSDSHRTVKNGKKIKSFTSIVFVPIRERLCHAWREPQVMEGGSSHNSPDSTKPISELETMQKLHDEKLSRIQELKGKKEAMMLELEKQKHENPEKMKGFKDLSEKYNSSRDQFFALLAERSQQNKK
ncbi:hypothetical protein Pfo_006665 [Paulownia fortunei]|nr:hypothetical protein Pfo_006665 [Paulownia fortunei]